MLLTNVNSGHKLTMRGGPKQGGPRTTYEYRKSSHDNTTNSHNTVMNDTTTTSNNNNDNGNDNNNTNPCERSSTK